MSTKKPIATPLPLIGHSVSVPFPVGSVAFTVVGRQGAQVTLQSPGGHKETVLWRDVLRLTQGFGQKISKGGNDEFRN